MRRGWLGRLHSCWCWSRNALDTLGFVMNDEPEDMEKKEQENIDGAATPTEQQNQPQNEERSDDKSDDQDMVNTGRGYPSASGATRGTTSRRRPRDEEGAEAGAPRVQPLLTGPPQVAGPVQPPGLDLEH